MVIYVPFATWALFKGPQATGWASSGTTQPGASIQESIKESDISHVSWYNCIQGYLANSVLGKSNQPTAGSFVRPSRPSDQPRSFLEALREKYASEFEDLSCLTVSESSRKKAIEISGKVVEEVGFDKIRKQLAELKELRIVLLDGLLVVGVLSSYDQVQDEDAAQKIVETCPKIIELDLSRSLLSRWRDVWEICNQLKHLKRLKLK
jgi:hypothetical protein